MATYFSIDWKIQWTEEPGRLQSMGLQKTGHNSAHVHIHTLIRSPLSSIIPKVLQAFIVSQH